MSYDNIFNAAFNTPHYATGALLESLEGLMASVAARDLPEMQERLETKAQEDGDSEGAEGLLRTGTRSVQMVGKTAVVPIFGPISKRLSMMALCSDTTSTDMLANTLRELRAEVQAGNVQNVILNVNTNGGSVEGVEVATREMRALREAVSEAGGRTIAVSNEKMLSAGYYIASAVDEIVVTPSAAVGSIGVLVMLGEESERLRNEGIKVHVVRSAEFKAKFNGAEPLSDADIQRVQNEVDRFHEQFVMAVSLNRKIDMADAEKLADGSVKTGTAAVEAGLADREGTLEGVLASLQAEQDSLETAAKQIVTLMEVGEDLKTELSASAREVNTLKAKVAEMEQAMEELERAQLKAAAETLIDAAIDGGKIAPKTREAHIERAQKFGIDEYSAILQDLNVGAAVPQEDIEVAADEPKAEDSNDPNIPKTEEAKRIYRANPFLREKYAEYL